MSEEEERKPRVKKMTQSRVTIPQDIRNSFGMEEEGLISIEFEKVFYSDSGNRPEDLLDDVKETMKSVLDGAITDDDREKVKEALNILENEIELTDAWAIYPARMINEIKSQEISEAK